MNHFFSICITLVALAAIRGSIMPLHGQDPANTTTQQETERPFVPGRILVKFKEAVDHGRAHGLLTDHGARSANVIEQIGVHVVELPANANEKAFANAFKGLDEVEFAELDRVLPPQAITPNDSYYNQQWLLWTMKASTAWSTTTGSNSIIIAFIDTGVDPNQFDLQSKLVIGTNLYDGGSIWDYIGHGTKVAGVNAATNNSFGVAGVCWGCRLMPIKVSDANGNASFSTIASGINWATNNGAKIANLGYAATDSLTVQTAARNMWDRGGLVFAPAGNDDTSRAGTFNSNPNNPYIITVGATQEQLDTHYSWSNTGNNIDLVAGGCVVTTGVSSMFVVACGTSFSSAAAAGVAALVLSVNPTLSPSAVEQILKQSAVDLGSAGWDTTFGSGRVDAAAAVSLAQGARANTATTLVSSLNPASVGAAVTFTATVSPSAATGTVTFKNGGTSLGTGTLGGGIATFSTSSLSAGTHSITATYGGNTGYYSSTSSTLSQTVSTALKTNTTLNLTSSANPSTSGQLVTFTVAVSPTAATGVVNFFDGGVNIGSRTISGGVATLSTSTLTVGGHAIQANYGGDANHNSSISQTVTQTVNTTTTLKTNTTTTLTSSLNPSTVNQSVTFTATVSPSSATGTVTFFDGAAAIGSATLSSGIARFSTASLATGTHSIKATYVGNTSFNGSSSPFLSQTVNGLAVQGSISLSANGAKVKGQQQANLTWSGATSSSVDIYRDGVKRVTTGNDGSHVDFIGNTGRGSYVYRVCAAGTTTCSNQATVSF